ncbi:MAG: SDR family oxidoreductase [Candidatus Krumholzibacteriia bacterium]
MDAPARIALVTGASSGIGLEVARGLARTGARVILVARDAGRGERARASVAAEAGAEPPDLLLADLSLLGEVSRLAETVLARHPRLDLLVANAGGFFGRRALTADGLERTFALNHLGVFHLTNRLLPVLRGAARGRVVIVASDAHYRGRVDLDDLQSARRYDGWRAYRASKLMNLLFAMELARRLAGDALTVNACHPGVVRTGLLRRGNRVQRLAFRAMGPFLIDAATAARVPLRLATDPVLTGVSGRYFDAAGEKRPSAPALDPDLAAALWTRSARLAADAQGAAGSDSAPDCC